MSLKKKKSWIHKRINGHKKRNSCTGKMKPSAIFPRHSFFYNVMQWRDKKSDGIIVLLNINNGSAYLTPPSGVMGQKNQAAGYMYSVACVVGREGATQITKSNRKQNSQLTCSISRWRLICSAIYWKATNHILCIYFLSSLVCFPCTLSMYFCFVSDGMQNVFYLE